MESVKLIIILFWNNNIFNRHVKIISLLLYCTLVFGEPLLVKNSHALPPPCPCSNNGCVEIGYDNATTLVSSLSSLSLGCYNVCGTLIIDENFTIFLSTINMGAGSKIIVNSNVKLTITFATIRGCNTMWQGIILNDQAQLEATNFAQINDAGCAIECHDGNTLYLENVFFNDNNIGIHGTTRNIIINKFDGNEFTFNGFKPFYSNQNPTPGIRSFAGIQLNNCSFYSIDGTNTFSNLQNGVVVFGLSYLTIEHFIFNNIVRTSTVADFCNPQYLTPDGIGVYLFNAYCDINYCQFTNATAAIVGDRTNLQARHNTITNVIDGIFSTRSDKTYQIMEDNIINSFTYRGISVVDQSSIMYPWARPRIQRNELHSGSQLTFTSACDAPIAILLRNLNQMAGDRGFVEDNKPIDIHGSCRGIAVYNCNFIDVQGNEITYNNLSIVYPGTQERGGIELENSTFCRLYDNSVVGFLKEDNQVKSFTQRSSSNIEYCCNYSDKTCIGFEFSGASNPTDFKNSLIDHHCIGIYCTYNCEIGIQRDKGNRWLAPAPSGVWNAYFLTTFGPQLLKSQFICAPCNSTLWPTSISPTQTLCSPPTSTDWFIRSSISSTGCAQNTCDKLEWINGNGNNFDEFKIYTENDGIIARRIDTNSVLGWESKRNLMLRLLLNSSNLGISTVTDSFYYASLGTNIEKYAVIERDIYYLLKYNNVYGDSLYISNMELNTIRASIDSIHTALVNASSQNDSTALMIQRNNIYNSEANLFNRISVLQSLYNSIRNAKIDSLKYKIANLSSNNIFQSNEKTVNLIYLNTLAIGNVNFTTNELSSLYSIASQCPDFGGKYVRIARSYYNLVDPNYFDDAIICAPQLPSPILKLKNTNNASRFLKIFPNPASNYLNIEFGAELENRNIDVEITNINGEIKYQFNLEMVDYKHLMKLSLKDLNSGLYFLTLKELNEKLAILKFVVE